MAVINKNGGAMSLPIAITRGNPIALDTTAVWYAKADLETYAASGATAYVGQILTLVEGGKCEAYMIASEAGTLIKLAATTASGDLAGDVATLQSQVADLISKVGKAASDGVAATGLYKEIADVLAIANAKVASVSKGDASVVIGGSATAPTVKVAVSAAEDNALELADDGLKVVVPEVTHPEYAIAKDANSGDYAAVYHLTKDGVNVGVAINIPKDKVLSAGTVEHYEAGSLPDGVTVPGTYIKLVFENSPNPAYINVAELVDLYTGAAAADGIITVNVNESNQITATIADGSITKAKLAAAVQTSLGKADSAVQSITTGSDNGTIAVDGDDIAVKGLGDAAYTTVSALNATAQGYADAAKEAVEGSSSDLSSAATVAGAKKYAEEKASDAQSAAIQAAKDEIAKLDVEDVPAAGKVVSAVSEVDGKISVSRRELVAEDIPELAQSKISGLAGTLAAKQDNLTFNTEYDAVDNKAATMSDVNAAKSAVIGGAEDTAASDTVKGAKKYADGKAADALRDAKAYADDIVSGDSGLSKRVDTLETKVDVDKVSTAIATAKGEAISDAGAAADAKVKAAKTAILGAEDYAQTVKSAYELATSKTTMAEVEAKDYATKAEAEAFANGKDAAIAAAKKAGDDAQDAADAAQADVNALKAKVGTVPANKTVVEMISDAQTAATYDDTAIKASIAANKTAIDKLNDVDSVEGSVANKVKAEADRAKGVEGGLRTDVDAIKADYLKNADKTELTTLINKAQGDIDAFLAGAEVGEAAVDTLKEIQEYIDNEGSAAQKMTADIAANKSAIEAEASRAKGAEETNATAISTEESRAKGVEEGLRTDLNTEITNARAAEKKNADDIAAEKTRAEGAEKANADAIAILNGVGAGSVSKTVADAIDDLGIGDYMKTADASAKFVAKNGTDRLMTATEGEKLEGIATGAQVNVIESISGVTSTKTGKDVKITGVSTDLFVQGTDVLIFDCGGAE